jgi:Leucine-rich repeat (LRR) protein
MQLSDIQPIIDKCVELEQLNFFQTRLSEESIDYLVKNITTKLSKLYLFTNLVQDKHIEVLVGRCINLTELNIIRTGITTDSLNYIIEKLQSTLVKLGLPGRFSRPEHFTKLVELKAMKKLTVLDLSPVSISDRDYINDSLRRQVPNAKIVNFGITLEKQILRGNFRCYE